MPDLSEDQINMQVGDDSVPFLDIIEAVSSAEWRKFWETNKITTRARFGVWSTQKDFEKVLKSNDAPEVTWSLMADFVIVWRACQSLSSAEAKVRLARLESEAVALDDAPIAAADKEQCISTFTSTYNHHYTTEDMPNDALLGRCVRDAKREVAKFVEISKIKSLTHSQMESSISKQRVGNVEIRIGSNDSSDNPTAMKTDLQFLMRLGLLMAALAITGVKKTAAGVIWHSLQASTDYMSAMAHAVVTVGRAKAMVADELVRKRVVHLVLNEKVTSTTAFTRALSEFRFMIVARGNDNPPPPPPQAPQAIQQWGQWNPNPKGKGKGKGFAPYGKGGKGKGKGKGGKGDKGRATVQMSSEGRRFCKPWNDSRNCPGGCGFLHACDIQLPSGAACEGAHRRIEHPGGASYKPIVV